MFCITSSLGICINVVVDLHQKALEYTLVIRRNSCMPIITCSLNPLMLVIPRIPRMSVATSETRRCAPVDNRANRRNKWPLERFSDQRMLHDGTNSKTEGKGRNRRR